LRNAPLKSPFDPVSLLTGRLEAAKAGVPQTWANYNAAVECVERGWAQGIGYELDSGGIYGVDLDHVIGADGLLSPEAREIVNNLASYTEISPSGNGLHIFVTAPNVNISRHRKKDCFVEVYNEARYFTVTGNALTNVRTIEARPQELQEIHDKFLLAEPVQRSFSQPPTATAHSNSKADKFLQIGLNRDRVLASLWRGGRNNGNESADDQALMNKLAYWCNADPAAMLNAFYQSPYFAQKDEAHKYKCGRSDYLPNTARKACVTAYSSAKVDYDNWNRKRHDTRYAR
jgi:putative DNA primase/helicase